MENLWLGLAGIMIGSFLNVVIYRVPRGESIAFPRSHCPLCGHPLSAGELVPFFSYLGQRGRCRHCAAAISPQYLAVEALTGVLFFYASWQAQGIWDWKLALTLALIASLVALAFIDWNAMILPDGLVFFTLLLGLIHFFFWPGNGDDRWIAILSGGGIGAVFALIAWIYPRGMGWGDVKLVAALGLYLGFPGILGAVFIASLTGILAGGTFLLIKKKGLRQEIPFGPFLAFGALSMIFWQQKLAAWYTGYIF